MSHKLGVCVPYRNRELHLNEFIPKVGKFLKEAGIDFQMYFAHQIDDKLFNNLDDLNNTNIRRAAEIVHK